jgi:TolA-binding protein
MLKQLYDLAIQLITLARDTQQNKTEITELRQEIRELRQEIKELRDEHREQQNDAQDLRERFQDLTLAVQRLVFELKRTKENEAHEREKLVLRLENELLRSRPILPPASTEPEPDETELPQLSSAVPCARYAARKWPSNSGIRRHSARSRSRSSGLSVTPYLHRSRQVV